MVCRFRPPCHGQFGGAWAGRVIQGPAVSGAPWMSGIEQLAETVATDMEQRLPGQRKTQWGKLALLGATMLQVRSANLMDVAACLPRPATAAAFVAAESRRRVGPAPRGPHATCRMGTPSGTQRSAGRRPAALLLRADR